MESKGSTTIPCSLMEVQLVPSLARRSLEVMRPILALRAAGTSKGSPMASSSTGWSAEESASRPAIRVDSGKNFAMEPLETDEADEVTSAFGKMTTF